MPSYCYKCEEHGEFEVFHSINEKLEFCPKCQELNKLSKVERLISSTSFVLAGGCWAKDNYK